MTSARVRPEERVGFVSVVGITFVAWGDLPNSEEFLKLRTRKSRLVYYVFLIIPRHAIPQPRPGFEYYYEACRKGDPETKAVTANEIPVAVRHMLPGMTGL